jgi:hypothetical protein
LTPPPGEPRFTPSAVKGTYLVFVPWAALPLGTVVKQHGGRRWEAYTRLGRSIGHRPTRLRAAAALAAWVWGTMPTPAQRHARKVAQAVMA